MTVNHDVAGSSPAMPVSLKTIKGPLIKQTHITWQGVMLKTISRNMVILLKKCFLSENFQQLKSI